MKGSFEHRVTAEEATRRLDHVLAQLLPDSSRSRIQRWIETGLFLVDGQHTKPSHRLKTGETVTGSIPEPEPSHLTAEPIPVAVIYEDEELLVVEKPAGMVVHPGSGIRSGTLANALLFQLGASLANPETLRPGIVHRLDKGTSGLLVVAKNEQSHHRLSDQFKSRDVEKRYLALVYGTPRQVEGFIDAPIGRDPVNRTRMSLRSPRGKQAQTRYTILEAWGEFSLLEIQILTGRTHQIRVHLSSIGHPVVGDTVYGAKRFKVTANAVRRQAIVRLGRLFLHACSLSFTHPKTGKPLDFQSPLPVELEELLTLVRS